MIINEDKIFVSEGDWTFADENKALACLLADDVCFLNNIEDTTCIYVNCNDVFAWGCADAEKITNNDNEEPSEIIDLYRLWKENNKWGSTKWVCLKRNQQPQNPIKKAMIKDNFWDDKLESLPKNRYDEAIEQSNRDRVANFKSLSKEDQDKVRNFMNPDENLVELLNNKLGFNVKNTDSASKWAEWVLKLEATFKDDV